MAAPTEDNLADLRAEIESLKVNNRQQAGRIRYLEKLVDTYLHSPVWKRIWFYVDGWPADEIASRPKPRPWRRKKDA